MTRKNSSSSGIEEKLCYSCDHSYKFRLMSRFGTVYVGIWFVFSATDVLLNPGGSIALNAPYVTTFGILCLLGGSYFTTIIANKTVGRLELLPKKNSYDDQLRITTYNTFGSERITVANMIDVVPKTALDDKSRLKKFCVRPEFDRAYLVFVEEDTDILDQALFQRITIGSPDTAALQAQAAKKLGWGQRRQRKKKKKLSRPS